MATIGGPNSIVDDGLIFYLDPLNKQSWAGPNSNTVNNVVGNNPTTIYNETSGSFGDNSSFAFDGTDDHMEIDSVINLGTVFSISFWIKTTVAFNSNTIILGSGTGNGTFLLWFRNYCLTFTNDSNNYYSPANYDNATVNTLSDGNWHNFVLTRNGTTSANMYVDAISVKTFSSVNSVDSQISIIGDTNWYAGWTKTMNGELSYLQFYNRVLSSSEITKNYNALEKGLKARP